MIQHVDYEKQTKLCFKCKAWKSFADFDKLARVKSGLSTNCKVCARAYGAAWMRKDYHKYLRKNREKNKRYYYEQYDHYKEMRQRRYERLKKETMSQLSGGEPKCNCCGENTWQFLCIDHVNGGGLKERRDTGHKGGDAMYRYIRRQGYPKDKYQILCHNCNMSKGFYGKCPHNKLSI